MNNSTGYVWLTGAGCAKREWLSLAAREALAAADCVVYDDLLAEGILDFASPEAERFYVGKRQGRHSQPQDETNALLIRLAGAGRRVCRLKGGDPFVFGRGGEEALALKAAGIPYEIIPGISSAVALPEQWGIPVTHRGLARAFHVITAHTASGDALPLPERLEALVPLAEAGDSLIFLMGLSRLPQLTEKLMALGLAPELPAAVLGSRAVRGTLADIARRAAGFPAPAVILIGRTAGLNLLSEDGPLAGLTIGLTGTAAFQQRVRACFQPCGGELLSLQQSEVEPCCAPEALQQALAEKPSWLAFTSPNGVRVFFSLFCRGGDIRALADFKFAAVGPGTAAALAEYGIRCDLVPAEHHTAALGEALASRAQAAVLLLGAEKASAAPEKALAAASRPFRRLPIYRLQAGPALRQETDYLIFGSAGGVENYLAAGGLKPRRAALCIGRYTAGRAEHLELGRVICAADATPQALLAALLRERGETES